MNVSAFAPGSSSVSDSLVLSGRQDSQTTSVKVYAAAR